MNGALLVAIVAHLAAAPLDRDAPSPWSTPSGGAIDGLFVGAQLFTGFDGTVVGTSPDVVLPAFRLDRAEFGGGGTWHRMVDGVLRFETIRSAQPQSAFGIDGNSLLPRLKLGYGSAQTSTTISDVDIAVGLRAGLVPEPWLEMVERHSGQRGLAPLPSERSALLATSDLGATLHLDVAKGLVDARVGLLNGEGKTDLERNASKDIVGVVESAPFAIDVFGAPLSFGLLAGGRWGTRGTGDVVHHRVLGALFASHPSLHVVVEAGLGQGFALRGGAQPASFGVLVDAEPLPTWLGVVARYETASVDLTTQSSLQHHILAGVFTSLGANPGDASFLRRLRFWAALDASFVDVNAGPIPGLPEAARSLRGLLTLEFTGLSDVIDPARWTEGQASPTAAGSS
jgi:hypothetical protein